MPGAAQSGISPRDRAPILEGRVRQGKSGLGLCFGYDVVRKFDASREAVRGERRINNAEAPIVRRIFEEFAIGRSVGRF